MLRGRGAKGRSAHTHIKFRQNKARRLKPLEDVASRELAARYKVQHLPDTGQIVSTLVAGGVCGANATAPSLWEKTVVVVWHIRQLRLSRTEAHYTTPHVLEGVPCKDVWATMQHLAYHAVEGFVATTGEGIELYGAVCMLPKRFKLHHLYRCRVAELVHAQRPGAPRLHWMPIAVEATHHERRTSIARFGEQGAPTTLQAAGY